MRSIERVTVRLLEVASALLLAVIVLLVLLQVFARYVLNSPTIWSEEAARLAFIYLTYIGGAVVAYRNRHLRIDVLVQLFPPRLQRVVSALVNAGSAAFLFIVLYYSIPLIDRMYRQGGLSSALEWNVAIFYAAVPIGALAMLPFVLSQAVQSGKAFFQAEKEG